MSVCGGVLQDVLPFLPFHCVFHFLTLGGGGVPAAGRVALLLIALYWGAVDLLTHLCQQRTGIRESLAGTVHPSQSAGPPVISMSKTGEVNPL